MSGNNKLLTDNNKLSNNFWKICCNILIWLLVDYILIM